MLNLLHIFLIVIGCLFAIITALYFNTPVSQLYKSHEMIVTKGVVSDFNLDFICKISKTCAANNPSSIYGRVQFPHKGDTNLVKLALSSLDNKKAILTSSHKLTYNDAIVVWGEFPQDVIYWGLTVNILDIYEGQLNKPFASVADTVSSPRYKPEFSTQKIGIIVTPNKNIVTSVQKTLQVISKNFLKVQFIPIIIPTKMYFRGGRYNILTRYVKQKLIPFKHQWNALWFKNLNQSLVQNIPYHKASRNFREHTSIPNERDFMKKEDWENLAKNKVNDLSKYTIIHQFGAKPYLAQDNFGTIPGGWKFGIDCVKYGEKCRADNPDAAYQVAANISLAENEFIVIVALNHITSGRIIGYSNVAIYDQVLERSLDEIMTSSRLNSDIPDVIVHVFKPKVNLVFVVERVYTSSSNFVGPNYDSLLPVQVFKVTRS